MSQSPPRDTDADVMPLTGAEQRRVTSLLDEVSTRTLLYSLVGLERDSADVQLIIGTLLARIPDRDGGGA